MTSVKKQNHMKVKPGGGVIVLYLTHLFSKDVTDDTVVILESSAAFRE